jgi:small subunit ribosomal protein S15
VSSCSSSYSTERWPADSLALACLAGPSTLPARSFHTTPITPSTPLSSKQNQKRKLELRNAKAARLAAKNAPKPIPNYILGHVDPPQTTSGFNAFKQRSSAIQPIKDPWVNCRLSKVLLHPQSIWNLPVPKYDIGEKPVHILPGLNESDRKLLFGALPHVTTALKYQADLPEFERNEGLKDVVENQEKQSEMMLRIMDLRNAGRERINAVNRRRVIEEFGQGWNVGSQEVQGGCLRARSGLGR